MAGRAGRIALLLAVTGVTGCGVAEPVADWDYFQEQAARPGDPGLYHEVTGAGPALLLIHGFATNLYTWRELRDGLGRDHRLWLLDLKGFGGSPKPVDSRYGIYDHAADVVRFIRHHELKDLTLVGNSLGGALALAAAIHFQHHEPGRIRALVLVDSAGYPQQLPLFMGVLRVPVLPELFADLVPREPLVRLVLRRLYYNDDLIPQASVAAYARPMDDAGGVQALIQTARRVVPDDLETVTVRYQSLDLPVLLVWGREDRIVPLAVGERLHTALRDSQLEIFDHCGHMPHEECPERVLPVVREFLEQQRPAVPPAG